MHRKCAPGLGTVRRPSAACMQVEAVARLCAAHGIPHVVNNAYGVQSRELCGRVSRASRVGRVDVVVQSTDKNFLVPVGGAVAAAPRALHSPRAAAGEASPPEYEGVVFRDMAARYPGRAAAAAHVDLLITLLHLGERGWAEVLREREEMRGYLQVRRGVGPGGSPAPDCCWLCEGAQRVVLGRDRVVLARSLPPKRTPNHPLVLHHSTQHTTCWFPNLLRSRSLADGRGAAW